MKLIFGLGNPGTQYEQTRHNAGFLALDHYLKNSPGISCHSKFNAHICELHFDGGNKVLFIKPQTFMNNSGEAVHHISNFYKVPPADMLIVHDEIDLPFGSIRTVTESAAAGHNGVKDIFAKLDTRAVQRIRIGIETRASRNDMPTDAFVLQRFSDEELKRLQKEIFPTVDEQIELFIKNKT